MSARPKFRGPASVNVAANVRTWRRQAGLQTQELADRTRALGWPMLPTAISKTEVGSRRCDVDDLAGLAVALGVSPNALLLPQAHAPDRAPERERARRTGAHGGTRRGVGVGMRRGAA